MVKQFKLATNNIMTFRQKGRLHLSCSVWTSIVGTGFSRSDATKATEDG